MTSYPVFSVVTGDRQCSVCVGQLAGCRDTWEMGAVCGRGWERLCMQERVRLCVGRARRVMCGRQE